MGNGTFGTAPNVLAGASPAFVADADFNHDGSPDLVVANFGGVTVSVALNNGGTLMGASQQQSDTSLTLTVTMQGSVVTTTVPTGGVEFQDHGEVPGRAVLNDGVASFPIAGFEKLPPKSLYSVQANAHSIQIKWLRESAGVARRYRQCAPLFDCCPRGPS